MPTTRGRLVSPNQVVYDQADYFQHDGYTRVTGLTSTNLTVQVYLNNVLQGWILTDGALVPDAQVVAGRVYISPISGGPYSIRWRPNAVGFWRILLIYPTGSQILAQDYDVTNSIGSTSSTDVGASGGLQTSFIRPGSRDDC